MCLYMYKYEYICVRMYLHEYERVYVSMMCAHVGTYECFSLVHILYVSLHQYEDIAFPFFFFLLYIYLIICLFIHLYIHFLFWPCGSGWAGLMCCFVS